jgi:cytochrome c biogenesis protein CcmG/thiol:disulfide interchange protein DsbE
MVRALPAGASDPAWNWPAIRGSTLVGINYKDKNDNALRFLGELGNPFAAVGVDPVGKAAIDWGVYGIPETYLVAPDGEILFKQIGPFTVESLRDKLLPAIEKAVSPAS